MAEPTEKQREYAYDIARWLDIPLPEEKTKSAYADFISKHTVIITCVMNGLTKLSTSTQRRTKHEDSD